jgi:hypothetical protein
VSEAASFVFVETAPHAVVLTLCEGVLKALGTDAAGTADTLCGASCLARAWEEEAQV